MNFNTPISTLWNSDKNVQSILDNSDSFEGRPFNKFNYPENILDKITTFHCDIIQPIHKLTQKDYDYVEEYDCACETSFVQLSLIKNNAQKQNN